MKRIADRMSFVACTIALPGFLLVTGCSLQPLSHARNEEAWAGLPPDCWTEARIYQTNADDWGWESRTHIERVALQKPVETMPSPNGTYYFAVQASAASRPTVLIYSEQPHLARVSFGEVKGLGEISWINERLLYMRVWWGRVAATDLVLDVEKERVVLAESTHWGQNAFEQYREMCALHGGCQCVDKASQ